MWRALDRWIDSEYVAARDSTRGWYILGRPSFTPAGTGLMIAGSILAVAISVLYVASSLMSGRVDWPPLLAGVFIVVVFSTGVVVYLRLAFRVRRGDFSRGRVE